MSEEGLLLLGLGLIAASLLLMVVEVFVPSGGLIAITAGIAALVGVISLFRSDSWWGLMGLIALMVIGPAALGFALKVWPNTPLGRRMLLGDMTEEQIEAERLKERTERDALHALVGAEGVAMTDLRPVGAVRIDGTRYDALAEVGVIAAGTKVRVTKVEFNQIKVREA